MVTHNLKVLTKFFDRVRDGSKKFEIRFNDRNYTTGDFVLLQEYSITSPHYSGRVIKKKIGFIADYEQKEGYVVFTLVDL